MNTPTNIEIRKDYEDFVRTHNIDDKEYSYQDHLSNIRQKKVVFVAPVKCKQ